MLPYYEEPTYHSLTPKELWDKFTSWKGTQEEKKK